MIMEIGIVAGEIWHFLEDKDGANVKEIQKGISREKSLVLMSLGWLAREGHVSVTGKPDAYTFRLIKGPKEE